MSRGPSQHPVRFTRGNGDVMSKPTLVAGAWPLNPQHLAYLATRAVRPDVAEAAGVRSLSPFEVSQVLGWDYPAGCAGMLVPHFDEAGAIVTPRIRLDAPAEGPKFQLPKGTPAAPCIPSSRLLQTCDLPVDALRDISIPILIVEGPVKALALLGVGLLAIGLGGVSVGGHDTALYANRGVLRAHPMLRERVRLAGRTVYLLFDAGIATNPSVADGAAMNALAFEAEEAEVWCVALPTNAKGGDQGPDDFLAHHGVEELRVLVSRAHRANPVARLKSLLQDLAISSDLLKEERQGQTAETALPLLKDLMMLAYLRRAGAASCEAMGVEFARATGMRKRVVTDAVEEFSEKLSGRHKASSSQTARTDGQNARPEIVLDSDLHESVTAAIAALAGHNAVFYRGTRLCELLCEERGTPGAEMTHQIPVVRDLSTARIVDLLSERARFMAPSDDGLRAVRPPDHVARSVESRGHWPGFRRLDSVVTYPILLPDGRVLDKRGYDRGSALFLHLDADVPRVPERPSQVEAQLAAGYLLSVVADFPFQNFADQSAFLCALLTPLARQAFAGNAPLFATTGNTPGCGKSKLNEVIALIVTGRGMPIVAPVEHRGQVMASERVDDNEMRKRLTAHVLRGSPMLLIDNAQVIGGNSINALLTCGGRWEDRLLGQSAVVSLPMHTVCYATGNNLSLPRETRRRSILIRLVSPLADPFRRSDFSKANLTGWVLEHRAELLRAALLILRAYIVAGRPPMALDAFGSFEGWSNLVRSAVVWAGYQDPLNTLRGQVDLDPETETLRSLLIGLEQLARGEPISAQRIIEAISHPPDPISHVQPNAALAIAIGELVAVNRPSAAQLSNALAPFVGRVLDGRKLARKRTAEGWMYSVLRDGDANDGSDGSRSRPAG